MIRLFLLVGGASATLTNTTRQSLLADKLSSSSGVCSDLGKHCDQDDNNCTSAKTGSDGCSLLVPPPIWLCGAEATCCVQNGAYLSERFIGGYAHFCDGADAVGDYGTNELCCSGQCCNWEKHHDGSGDFSYKCGHGCFR